MKIKPNKKYLEVALYVAITVVIIYGASLLLKNAPNAIKLVYNFLMYTLDVLSPVLMAVVFSYILNPAVEKLQGFYYTVFKNTNSQKRICGTFFVYVIVFTAIFIIGYIFIRSIGSADIDSIANVISRYANIFYNFLADISQKISTIGIKVNLQENFQIFLSDIEVHVSNTLLEIGDTISNISSNIMDIVIALTASFYMLSEKERLLDITENVTITFLKPKHASKLFKFMGEVNNIFSAYIGGQLTDVVIMTLLYSISFFIIGIDYPVFIGMISGVSNIVPYFGAIVGFLLSVGISLFEGNITKAVITAIVVICLQQIENAIIMPKLIGQRVNIHPVTIILALAIFSKMFGFIGLIIAVPVSAIIKSISLKIYSAQKRKNLYEYLAK